ncbi:hypothetical protein SRHO_G00327980 [Serrasalmus rhombeus]
MKPKGFGTVISAQLHHFCDASEVGYGTVSYIRFASDRNVHVSFVVGKARVAPLKQMTIPRLELQAATLASRMDKMLRVELQMNLEPSVIWTESQSVLKDINNEQTRFSTFVTNRLTVIRDLTTKEQWRYVGSANNPADAASRGVRAVSLMSKHWWTGPDFLRREETHWPIIGKLMSTDLKDLEVRNVQVHWTTVTDNPTIKFLEYYSQWNHFKRALAWFLRLKDILKTKIQGKDAVKINSAQNVGSQCLSVDELERAENAVISYVQNSSFHEEVEALQKDVFKEKRENRRWQISVQNGSPQTYHLLPIDILLDSEPDEDPQMLSSPKHPYSPCDEMENLADIIRDFKRENISEHSTLTVVARRRRILHSAITALNKGYFDWHKRPQIEFVGEMADDYGGPTREFFRSSRHNGASKDCILAIVPVQVKENVISSKDLEKWPYLRNVDIKEIDADVELLIGVNTPKAMEPWEIINSIGNGPYAVRTMLGWIVNGPLGSMGDVTNHHVVTTNRISVSEIEELLIKQYNQEFPETHYTEKREMSLDDKKFMKILTEQVTYENSHYYLPLPFRNDNVMMPNNREVAIRRAASLAKRLKGDKSFQAEYKQFMDKMLEQDYAEEIPLDQLHVVEGKIWYVPHHGVYHRRKGTLRVVFDCTSSFQNTSLNKELLQGPDLTNNLLGVLMRFHQGHIALMADIQAMFHQVRVHRKHVDFLRFLWWPDGDFEKQPEDYRMKVHLFGAISSPSCANFALQKTAQDNQHNYDKEENVISSKDLEKWPYLRNVDIKEIDADVELLIGVNTPKAMEPWEIINSIGNGPYAVRTMLGWIVNGPLGSMGDVTNHHVVTTNRISVSEIEELLIKQYNQEFPETHYTEKREMSLDDKKFMKILTEQVTYENSHYYLPLPFRNDNVMMPNNREVAIRRAASLAKRLKGDKSFQAEYKQFMDKMLEQDYAEEIPLDQLHVVEGKIWYVPHHGVYHRRKGTLRVVFDCTSSFQNTSLNKELLQGPDLTNNLLGVLMRFHQGHIALMADIQAMFHQVRVHRKHVDFLRFLWWPDGDFEKQPEDYRMKVHLFGAISSPSCANFALQKTAQDNQHNYDKEENVISSKDLEKWPYLRNVDIKEIDADVELLIGVNTPKAMEPWEIINSIGNGPYAVRTMLGWIVNGPLGSMGDVTNHHVVTTNRISVSEIEELLIKQYNQEFPETHYTEKREMSLDDKKFMKILTEQVTYENSHYYLPLPFRNDNVMMPNNREVAIRRAASLAKRLKGDKSFQAEYKQFMDKMLEQDYAEEIPLDQLHVVEGKIWYVPHHGVYHRRKGTLRVVFDCTSSFQNTSLNKELLQGPDLTNNLLGVLMRFRQGHIALMADIQAMFHQVRVHRKHVDFLRFLWWPDGDFEKQPEDYRMKVHLFGAVSSPSCANFALQKTAQDNQHNYDKEENVISSKDLEKWPYLRNVDIKEIDADVELLIGVNTPKAMEPWEIINSIGNGPYAVRTMLGWIVNGPLGSMGDVTNHHVVTTNRISVSEIEELLIKQYNQEFPETHYTEKREMSLDDKKFMKILTEQVTYENSHYYLPLPFRNDNVMMPNNREVAIRRAASLAKRLKGDKSFQAEYKQFMDKMLEQDYAEEIPLDQLHVVEGKIWYVPHHGVYHRRKGTLRVVFDCTSSFQNTSLNKELLQGPDLTNNLLGVLMRFHQGHIALMADIQAMFHQVRVHRKHVDFLRFLWWPDGDFEKQPEDYRMKVHLFGAISSPSCANFALQKTAQDNQHNYDKEEDSSLLNGSVIARKC